MTRVKSRDEACACGNLPHPLWAAITFLTLFLAFDSLNSEIRPIGMRGEFLIFLSYLTLIAPLERLDGLETN